jgi:hypothetical protein
LKEKTQAKAKNSKTSRTDAARPNPTEPTAQDIAARKAIARTFFNPDTAAAARAAFRNR